MTDTAWIDSALTSARPQAVGALLRYFRNLDTAEEAFQNACLRALKSWPQNGPPRDPAAWLIMVGRNVAIDDIRRRPQAGAAARGRPRDLGYRRRRGAARRAARRLALPRRHSAAAVHLLPSGSAGDAADRAGAAHRLGPLRQADRARLSGFGEAAMEQRITRAKARVAEADVPFETPGAVERTERLGAVAAMIYLIFNEGYSASGDAAEIRSAAVRGGDPAGAAVAAAVPERARDHGADRAAVAAARARRGAVRCRRRGDPARRPGSHAVESAR